MIVYLSNCNVGRICRNAPLHQKVEYNWKTTSYSYRHIYMVMRTATALHQHDSSALFINADSPLHLPQLVSHSISISISTFGPPLRQLQRSLIHSTSLGDCIFKVYHIHTTYDMQASGVGAIPHRQRSPLMSQPTILVTDA